MNIWAPIFLVTNAIYWAVFFYLLSRRRWNAAALMVGLFHMLLASVLSVAPFRSLLDSVIDGSLASLALMGEWQ
jgi:hypothetical protein